MIEPPENNDMPEQYIERSLIDFPKYFLDSDSCAKHLAEQRRQDGFICPRYGHRQVTVGDPMEEP